MAEHSSNNEEIVIASVQSLARRLDKFEKNEFDTIIVDEAHHAIAPTYQKILNYFTPRLVLGFTATPNRGDNLGLSKVFDKIIYQKDIRWAIKNNFLVDIECLRVNIGYDISQVARRMGDFAIGELSTAMNIENCNKAIAEAYYKHAKGKTLIFATTVDHALAIADTIKGAKAIVGDTKDRQEILEEFRNGDLQCLVNCMIFTEGADIPNIETIMIARPTQNDSLYTQMVGRGLRLYENKEKLRLIDLVGVTGRANICSAPSLLGLDLRAVSDEDKEKIQAESLFDLEPIVERNSDTIHSWIENTKIIDIWSRENRYKLHDINFFRTVSGELVLNLPDKVKFVIRKPDELGYIGDIPYQEVIDNLYITLNENYKECEYIWNKKLAKKWAKQEPSEKQLKYIKKLYKKGEIPKDINKLQASFIINRLSV